MVEKGFTKGNDDSVYYDGGNITAKEVEDRVVKKPVEKNNGKRKESGSEDSSTNNTNSGSKRSDTVVGTVDNTDATSTGDVNEVNYVTYVDNSVNELNKGDFPSDAMETDPVAKHIMDTYGGYVPYTHTGVGTDQVVQVYGHQMLDTCGLICDMADVINGVWYALEGDNLNAAICGGASIPFYGIFATTAKYSDEMYAAGKMIKEGIEETGEKVAKGMGETKSLFHYTSEKGMNGILESKQLNPSLKSVNPKDVRYGNGQYLSDIVPGEKSPAQLSRQFINVPNKYKYTHYVEIDIDGLNVVKGRNGVFVIPNNTPLDVTSRLISSGKVNVR